MSVTDSDGGYCSPWTTPELICSAGPGLVVGDSVVEDAAAMATEILFNFTRRRWPGLCTDTVRPCWRQVGCVDRRSCGCGSSSGWDLPGHPVVDVTQVKVDGLVVPADEYTVDNAMTLVGLMQADGHPRVWPLCQNLRLADTEDNTWSVTYTYGFAPPVGGRRAATALAIQLAYAWTPEGKEKCRLPKRVTTISRQGVSMAIIDPLSLFAEGLTGLAEVDLWVASVNRGTNTAGGAVIDPMKGRTVTRRT